MIGDALGKTRRSHHAAELDHTMDGRTVTIMGWVTSSRGHGNIAFATIRDRTGDIQVVAKKGVCPDDILDTISSIKPHSSVGITGTVSASPRAPGGIEVMPTSMDMFSRAGKTPPFEPAAKSVKNIDTRLEVRCIDLRREPLQHMFRARTAVLRDIRQYFARDDFTEISTPKIIASATEGGAALFPIFYYNKEAFLAQSPQLYKEQLTMSFERVFEIAPIFRAEPSRTNRHLCEAISVDMEEAFVDYTDIMDRTCEILRRAASAVSSYAQDHPGCGFRVPDMDDVPRYAYGELADRIQKAGFRMEWGDDLHPSWLRKIGLEGAYFITDWPMGPKPFYVKTAADPRVSESFDLMWGDLEISSGSTRIDRREDLERNLANKGMNPDSFSYHLEAFEYGVPPHAGCGIGLERLMMALTGTDNIRDTTFYPRDPDRLRP